MTQRNKRKSCEGNLLREGLVDGGVIPGSAKRLEIF